jgi:hypothetical protein
MDYVVELRNVLAPIPVRVRVDDTIVYEGSEERIRAVHAFPSLAKGATRMARVEVAIPDGWKHFAESRSVDREEERERREMSLPVLIKIDHEVGADIPGLTTIVHTSGGRGVTIAAGAIRIPVTPGEATPHTLAWIPRPSGSGVGLQVDDQKAVPFPATRFALIDVTASRCYRITDVTYRYVNAGPGSDSISRSLGPPRLIHELHTVPNWLFEQPPSTIESTSFESVQSVLTEAPCD